MPEIPRCHQPTIEEFEERFAVPGLPVILTGITDHWPARSWTPEKMAERLGDVQVEVTPKNSTVEGTKSLSFANYVQRVLEGASEGDYLTSWCFRRDYPELLADFEVPLYFQDDWLEELPTLNDMMWLFLGAEGSGMGLHQDLGHTAAWNAQVTGLKEWALVAPEYEDYLYEGEVCAFKPNRVRHSKFRKAEVWRGEVRAGEVLFIPGAWWHQTRNLKTGFAITANFVNRCNYQRVLRCLQEAEEPELYEMLKSVAERKMNAWR